MIRAVVQSFGWLIAPVERRALVLLLAGTALFTACGGIASLFEPPPAVNGLLALVMLNALLIGACGMVGYFRWLFNPALQAKAQADRERRT